MSLTDLIYICTNPECLKKEGTEAQTEQRDSRVHVLCGLCGRRRNYSADALNRESPALVAENLRGHFEVRARYGE